MISEGDNIVIKKVPNSEDVVISSNVSIRHGDFILSDKEIIIEAEKGIVITTSMPNKIRIGIDINKFIVEIDDLKKRFANLEQVVMTYVKK